MYYNRKIYDIASKYKHRLISLDEALLLCRGKEEEFFSALQDIDKLQNNIKQYYIIKNTSNVAYSVESFRYNLTNMLNKIHEQIQSGDRADGITNQEASLINEIFKNRTLKLYLTVAKLNDELLNKDIKVVNYRDVTISADDIKEPETPTIDRCAELYYEYIGKGDLEKAHAIFNIITYKSN